eukprot:TRINITY_DN13879_c0_g1_i1.p2 TRINITY_DN13879_c0_g1~~TRINITY_DN13879_c0_g1_i1.p2  ORF type:complete len:201 (+),score=52.40 TRINITY_DN13879_c0_g1_i1:64-666(+)
MARVLITAAFAAAVQAARAPLPPSQQLLEPCDLPRCDAAVCRQSTTGGCTVCTRRVCGSLSAEADCSMRPDCFWVAEPTDGISDKCRSNNHHSSAPCTHLSEGDCANDTRCEWETQDNCTRCYLKYEVDVCSHMTAEANCLVSTGCVWSGDWCSERAQPTTAPSGSPTTAFTSAGAHVAAQTGTAAAAAAAVVHWLSNSY